MLDLRNASALPEACQMQNKVHQEFKTTTCNPSILLWRLVSSRGHLSVLHVKDSILFAEDLSQETWQSWQQPGTIQNS